MLKKAQRHEGTKARRERKAYSALSCPFVPSCLRASVPSLSPQSSVLSPRGFTLIELMVVISIIVLVLAMSVPLVRTVEGARSLEAGYNQVNGALSHARELAIYYHAPAGVAFYYNVTTNRPEMAYVMQEAFIAANFAGIMTNDVLVGTPTKHLYAKLNSGADPHFVDIIPGDEIQTLPSGVAVQLVNSAVVAFPTNVVSASNPVCDRYLPMGVVMFDENGQLASQSYWIAPGFNPNAATAPTISYNGAAFSFLGYYVGLLPASGNTVGGGGGGSGVPAGFLAFNSVNQGAQLFSHPALCIYDSDAYDTQVVGQTGDTFVPSANQINGDSYLYGAANANSGTAYFQTAYIPGANTTGSNIINMKYDKPAEQDWLDQNGQIYVIKPNDGSLLRNQ